MTFLGGEGVGKGITLQIIHDKKLQKNENKYFTVGFAVSQKAQR